MDLKKAYSGRKVLVTGHTGFKGSWMCRVLKHLGAEVIGYSLEPPTDPNLFNLSDIEGHMISIIADIRDLPKLKNTVNKYQPEIVIHLAAQPLVSIGYSDPVLTYSTNVMGTVNLLEAIRTTNYVRSFLNVTTDKVYRNNEWAWGYRENEYLDGFDPYSNSKSCSELVTSCFNNSFLKDRLPVSTARAGNVIGGGDFTDPRIIPDCVRAALDGHPLVVRNPYSTRPYQHVLEPVFAYLMIAAVQMEHPEKAGSYNVGPADEGCINNEKLITLFGKEWGEGFQYEVHHDVNAPHEANFLKLDCSKINSVFGWSPTWDIGTAVRKTVEWTKAYIGKKQVKCMDSQIEEFYSMIKW
ncbi:MAG: CDP-glucose 4,6-dehydratase [Candidatus Methanomethylophilaceae archaeon]|nr:CDP-glucose 4,6-dehydratase [Candidatus Methanomethylophilaceae archaeon]